MTIRNLLSHLFVGSAIAFALTLLALAWRDSVRSVRDVMAPAAAIAVGVIPLPATPLPSADVEPVRIGETVVVRECEAGQ